MNCGGDLILDRFEERLRQPDRQVQQVGQGVPSHRLAPVGESQPAKYRLAGVQVIGQVYGKSLVRVRIVGDQPLRWLQPLPCC